MIDRYPDVQFLRLCDGGVKSMKKPEYAVYCLGNFDGVHIAHKQLIYEGINQKKRRSEVSSTCLCGAFIFTSPSCDYFPPYVGKPKKHLTTFEEKLEIFASIGLDFVAVCDFEDVRELSPEDFLDLLHDGCACRAIVCGYNYSFGKFAKGNPDFIKEYYADDADFSLSVVSKVKLGDCDVSSTQIRRFLAEGNVRMANTLLGYRYALTADVIGGKQLGRRLGFPTANQLFDRDSVIPESGVYATVCHTPDGIFPGVSNVGVRPTVDGQDINCETYIIGFEGDLYSKRIKVEFVEKLREEKKFASIDELSAAIAKNAEQAQKIFESL
jgi:riboflavin kinase/FMN adenylyltransferase